MIYPFGIPGNFRIIILWNHEFLQIFNHYPYGIPPIFDGFSHTPMEFHCISQILPPWIWNGNAPPQPEVQGFFLEKPVIQGCNFKLDCPIQTSLSTKFLFNVLARFFISTVFENLNFLYKKFMPDQIDTSVNFRSSFI